MAWKVRFAPKVDKMFAKLGMDGFWRYRVGDYRVICRIIDDEVTILVVKVGHRKEVYQ